MLELAIGVILLVGTEAELDALLVSADAIVRCVSDEEATTATIAESIGNGKSRDIPLRRAIYACWKTSREERELTVFQ